MSDFTTWPSYYQVGNYGAFCGAISYKYSSETTYVRAYIYWLGEGLCTNASDAASNYNTSESGSIRGDILVGGLSQAHFGPYTISGNRSGYANYSSYVWFKAGGSTANYYDIPRGTSTKKLSFKITYVMGDTTYTKTTSEITIDPLPKYTITFKDGTSTYATKTCYYGNTVSSWPTAPTKNGYAFKGWYTASSGGTLKTSSSTFTSDTTLYAQWTANTYTVTLNKNEGSGGTNSVTATYSSAMPSATMPTRTGYTFAGYYDATSGGTQYYTSAGASARTWNKTSATTLYAHWTPNIYTITLNKNEGSGGTTTIYVKYATGWYSNSDASTSIVSITAPTRSNYIFDGYYTADTGGTQIIYSNGNMVSGHLSDFTTNTTLYAHWILANKTITYNKNGGTGDLPDNITILASESVIIGTNNLTKSNNNPNGWNTNSSGNGTHYNNGATYTETSDLTLYAEWTAYTYIISYDANGGTGAPSPGSKTYNEPYTISQTIPTRTNYTFIGWMEGSTDSNNIYQPGNTYTKDNSITFYAKWESNDFSISFDNNYLQDYNISKTQLAFGTEALDNPPNSNFSSIPQGIYVSGNVYVKSKILDSIGAGVLSGELIATTIERAVQKASYSSGIMGSVITNSSYTKNSITIPSGRYNMLYIPHRTGGTNGQAEGSNTQWGSMLLFGMMDYDGIYRIKYGGSSDNGGTIDKIEQIYPQKVIKTNIDATDAKVTVQQVDSNDTIECSVSLSAATSNNHGVWSNSNNNSNGQWIIYQDTDGNTHIGPNGTHATTGSTGRARLAKIYLGTTPLRDILYPVGSIYMSTVNTSPATIWGGNWESIGVGKTLVCAGSGYTAGTTGGEKTKSYTPKGTIGGTSLTVKQIPAHRHAMHWHDTSGDSTGGGWWWESSGKYSVSGYTEAGAGMTGGGTSSTNLCQGDSHTHTWTGTEASINVEQPWYAVYMWRRLAD